MKKIILSLALMVATLTTFAQTDPYTVTLAQAVWNFNEGDPTAPSLSSENFPIPANCFDATGGSARTPSSAYLPYIKPGLLQDQTESFGYNGEKYALYFGTANNPTSRMPAFMMFPTISDAAYTNLELQFYARQENATAQRLKIGYITDMSGINQSTHKFSGTINNVATLTLTATYSLQKVALATVPAGAYVVLYADITEAAAEYFYIDDIKFATKSGSTPEPENPTVTYNLTHCTGSAENPTEVTEDDDLVSFVFTPEDGYDWDDVQISVLLGTEAITDDVEEDNWYMFEPERNTLSVYVMEGYTENLTISIEASKTSAPVVTPIPGAATFEEYLTVLPQEGDKYNPYDADGTHYWQSGDYTFSCTRSWSGAMNDGFYPANYSDTVYVDYNDDYKALPCAGANGSSAYCSMYYGGSWGGPCAITFSERTLTGTYVVLPLNPYLCIHGRNGGAAAFKDGDYLLLRLSGKKNGVYTNTHVDFYLADYRNGKQIEITDWTWLDLSSLGAVDEVEVTMSDSQNGAGIGDYACFDNFGGTAPTATSLGETIPGYPTVGETKLGEPQKLLLNGQVFIRRGEHIYNTAGQIVR